MHEYFGGTARILVPDDCKNAVVPKALSEKKRAISEAYYMGEENPLLALLSAIIFELRD